MHRAIKKQPAPYASGKPPTGEEIIAMAFASLDCLALGLAIGVVAGAALLIATVILVLKGGNPLGPNLSLLNEYIPGYSVSWRGSFIGAAGGFGGGFALGWSIAALRNLTLRAYLFVYGFWARLNRFLENV